MKKYSRFITALSLYVGLTLLIHFAHARLLTVDVVLYSALSDAVMSALLLSVLLWGWRYFDTFTAFEKMQMLCICLLGGYVFAISVPTVIDRSLSMYILEKLDQRGGSIRQSAFEDVFTKEYVREHRLVDVRLTEQVVSGTIRIENGCVSLTPRGQRIAEITRFYRTHLLPKQRLLMGQYSDDLTDPFRHSVKGTDYGCH